MMIFTLDFILAWAMLFQLTIRYKANLSLP